MHRDAVNRGSVSLDTQSTGVYFVAALSYINYKNPHPLVVISVWVLSALRENMKQLILMVNSPLRCTVLSPSPPSSSSATLSCWHGGCICVLNMSRRSCPFISLCWWSWHVLWLIWVLSWFTSLFTIVWVVPYSSWPSSPLWLTVVHVLLLVFSRSLCVWGRNDDDDFQWWW